MLASASSLLLPMALTASLGSVSPVHHDVLAYVTGYNTIPGQTDSTPCVAASGADICGRRDAVACPRHIGLGTTVEIHGATYICEDRLAKKFDTRFDISCDKDTACPPQVTGWATIRVYDDGRNEPAAPVVVAAAPVAKAAAAPPAKASAPIVKLASVVRRLPRTDRTMIEHDAFVRRVAAAAKASSPIAQRLANAMKTVSVLRGRG